MRKYTGDLAAADDLARRFVRAQLAEAQRLGYPHMAAFAKDIARGTVAITPPEDPEIAVVGEFIWQRKEIERRLVMSHYDYLDNYGVGVKAKRLGMSRNRYNRLLNGVLHMLFGYISAIRTQPPFVQQ